MGSKKAIVPKTVDTYSEANKEAIVPKTVELAGSNNMPPAIGGLQPARRGVPETSGSDVEALIARAIDKNVPVETMEKLLAMRRELKAEAAREAYFRALRAFQAELPVIKKTKTVYNKNDKPIYNYAPLESIVEQVRALLDKHGFSYHIDTEQAGDNLKVRCISQHEQGHSETTTIEVPVGSDYMTAQQMVGSARTFAMRYAFCNAFGILTGDDDDDGNAPGQSDAKASPYVRQDSKQSPPPAQGISDAPSREELKAKVEELLDNPLFPSDVRASAKKYIARADASMGKALSMAQKVLATAIKEKAEPRIENDTGQLDDNEMEPEMFGTDPYTKKNGEGNLS